MSKNSLFPTGKPHISFSEIKQWKECSYRHKLVYIDRLAGFEGNEYTAFGTALHHVCENLVVDNSKVAIAKLMFQKKFYSLTPPSYLLSDLDD